jgi:YD repeat-containing protein
MFLGIIPIEQHIFRPRLTGTKNPLSETENYTYDAGSRRTSYTMNGGNSIRYDYDALNDLVEKTYQDEKQQWYP